MGTNLILNEVTNAITFVWAIYCKSVYVNYKMLMNENIKLMRNDIQQQQKKGGKTF